MRRRRLFHSAVIASLWSCHETSASKLVLPCNSAVFPRNCASFRPVPRGEFSSCGLRFLGASFYAHAAVVA